MLAEILAAKRTDVAARLKGAALDGARPTTRSLAAALARPGARFILEVKRASPSAGTLRRGADPAEIARAYAGPADAISILTDGPFFGGSLADLAAVRSAFDGPILAKDFIVDPRQVAEARLHGADAVLVMLCVLGDGEAALVMGEARRLGMDALIEAHDAAEVRRAIALGAQLIGINNRDLRTLGVDLAVTERLAPLVPADRILVAESGISSRADVARLAPHADAFLVGSALMRADGPGEAARALVYGRVKVCGLTNAADLAMAARAGATHAGLVLVPGTPRAVTPAQAEAIVAAARARTRIVGIFRDETAENVAGTALRLGLDAVQLHGDEDAAAFRARLPDHIEIWAAVSATEKRAGADRILFDSGAGGTGRAFDWNGIAARPELRRGLLAGGLNPGNVRAASRLGAWALDVGSGLEAVPRWKDSNKVAAFFEALRPEARAC